MNKDNIDIEDSFDKLLTNFTKNLPKNIEPSVMKKMPHFVIDLNKILISNKEELNERIFDKMTSKLAKKYHVKPSKSQMSMTYKLLIEHNKIEPNFELEKYIVCKSVRSASGVLPVTSVMKPSKYSCGQDCYYCPNEPGIARSYISSEPAVMRGLEVYFDCVKQVFSRLDTLRKNGHKIDKIEMIIEGGTFFHYEKNYREEYSRDLYYAVNVYEDHILGNKLRERYDILNEQTINITSKYRIIGKVLETRPDTISRQSIKELRFLGYTRVQIGVQHTNNNILKLVNRSHTVECSIKAMKLLKDNGIKVDMHIMPDLPGTTPDEDKKMMDFIFDTPHLCADYMKVYPCLDVKFTVIREWKEQGIWKPYSEENKGEDLYDVLLYMKRKIPRYLRINRLQRDFPESSDYNKEIGYESEYIRSNLRQLLLNRMEKLGEKCLCIRCREVKLQNTDLSKAELTVQKYESSDGIEYFISFVEKESDILYGFVRLRFPSKDNNSTVFKSLKNNTAFIRELHVYGKVIGHDEKNENKNEKNDKSQHLGFGKRLMLEAERITLENGYDKIAVISGVGVRNYYEKLGYKLNLPSEGSYMVKQFEKKINYDYYNKFNYLFFLIFFYTCLFAIFLYFNK